MNASLFIEYVEKYFRSVVGKVTELWNGKKEEQALLFKTHLNEEYSADLNWGSTEINQSVVAADVVSLESSLPLKKRGSIRKATGVLPKLGMKYRKGEKAITDINVMIARGADEATIAGKIFDDTSKVIKGIDVRNEIMFLQGLSTGQVLIGDADGENDGTGIRADFGYKDENTFHAITAAWGGASATPQDDLNQLFDQAQKDGNSISDIFIDRKYFDYFRHSAQGKLLYASYAGSLVTNVANIPVPSRNQFMEALRDEYSATFHVVNSSFRIQKHNGDYETVTPWDEGSIVATPSATVGCLVYGTLAEETNPVNGVNYEKSGSYTLVKKFSKTDPLEEFTAGEAMCLPVIDGVDSIYILHADSTGKLTVDPSELSFTASADTTGKKVTVHADSEWTANKGDASWVTLSKRGETLTVKVSANDAQSAAERTATITITDADNNTATITVTQAA
jgi:hypothetical protein